MNAIALKAQSQPTCSDWIVFACGNHRSAVIVGRIGNASDDRELPGRARANIGSDRDLKSGDDNSVVDDGQLTVDQADEYKPIFLLGGGGYRTLCPTRKGCS
jgi:hypothetical protein